MALRIACVLTLIGLALMVWSMLQPTWLPIIVAMSVGQGIGMMAFSIFAYRIVTDLRGAIRKGRETP
jgi:MFS family permease